MIRRFGTVLALACASVACFEADSGEDEIAETGTGSESTGESESTNSTTTEESTSEASTESTTESSTEESTTESTTGEPEPVCGNGVVEDGEVCDDGPMPELMPGACAPDCSKVIDVKHIFKNGLIENSDLGPNPVAAADSLCPIGHKAMFVYGNVRVATTVPWQSVGSVDWPIQPYTAYVNNQEELIWVTDEVRLLAVRDGQQQPPIHPLFPCEPCIEGRMVSGMAPDGTNLLTDTCDGWTSTNPAVSFAYGSFIALTSVIGSAPCSDQLDFLPGQGVLCVEL